VQLLLRLELRHLLGAEAHRPACTHAHPRPPRTRAHEAIAASTVSSPRGAYQPPAWTRACAHIESLHSLAQRLVFCVAVWHAHHVEVLGLGAVR
jgi:hypothetical protein